MIIYLVTGESGEWDDYRSWIVMGFKTFEAAVQRANLAEEFAKKEYQRQRSSDYDHKPLENPFDKILQFGSYQVSYSVSSVLVEEE